MKSKVIKKDKDDLLKNSSGIKPLRKAVILSFTKLDYPLIIYPSFST